MTDAARQMIDLRERCLERAREDVKGAGGWAVGVVPTPQNVLIVATAYLDFITGQAGWYPTAHTDGMAGSKATS